MRCWSAALCLLVLCTAVSSCGRSDSTVKAVLKPEFAVTPTATSEPAVADRASSRVEPEPSDDACTESLNLDALGFVVAPPDCEEQTSIPSPASYATMEEFFGEDDAENLAAAVRDRLVMQTGCLPPEEREWRGEDVDSLIAAVPDAAIGESLRVGFRASTEADTYCNIDKDAWIEASQRSVEAFRDVHHLLVASDEPLPEPDDACCPTDVSVITSRLAMASDDIYTVMNERTQRQSSEFWRTDTHLHHVRELHDYVPGTDRPITTVFLGSSVVIGGVNTRVVEDSYNLGIQALQQPDAEYIAEAAMSVIPEIETIVWGQTSKEFMGCIDLIESQFAEFKELRESAFDPVEWVSDIPTEERLLGQGADAPRYVGTTIDASVVLHHGDKPYGDLGVRPEGPDAEKVAARLEWAVPLWEKAPQPCQERMDLMLQPAARWAAEGKRVVLVFWPLPEQIRQLHPEGNEIHETALADVRAQAEALDIEVLDLSTLVPETGFYDLSHLGESGRIAVTEAIISYLAT